MKLELNFKLEVVSKLQETILMDSKFHIADADLDVTLTQQRLSIANYTDGQTKLYFRLC